MAEQETIEQQNVIYEISFLQKSEGGDAVKRLVGKFGGTVLRERPIAKMRLAYKVRKEPNAFFGLMKFTMPGEGVRDLRAALRLEDDVLRALVVRAKEENEEAIPAAGDGKDRRRPLRRVPGRESKSGFAPVLSNEAIEKKIEELQ